MLSIPEVFGMISRLKLGQITKMPLPNCIGFIEIITDDQDDDWDKFGSEKGTVIELLYTFKMAQYSHVAYICHSSFGPF